MKRRSGDGYKETRKYVGSSKVNTEASGSGGPMKRRKVDPTTSNFTSLQTGRLTSGHVYCTKVRDIPECFNENAFSLSQLLNEIKPELSLHFNFMIEPDWLLRQYPPNLRKTPITLVVGASNGTTASEVRRLCEQMHAENVQVSGAKMPIPFGSHHTKISIYETSGRIHVLVMTANLVEGDWGGKTQGFYYCSALLDCSTSEKGNSPFQEDLLEYMRDYKLPALDYWIERIASAHFLGNTDRLMFSCPGYHKGDRKNLFGHLRLRKVLAEAQARKEATTSSALLVAQCSSIGSLGNRPEQWMFSQFLNSLRGGKQQGHYGKIKSRTKRTTDIFERSARRVLSVLDSDQVRDSVEGYVAGGSLPYSSATDTKQQWLRSKMCRWRSETRGRSRAMPHVKSYVEFLEGVPQWMLLTSANLSKAAWGDIQKNGEQLMVRSYEAGVLIMDPKRIEVPFDYPIARYQKPDEPWLVDKKYPEPDRYGKQWIA